MYFYNIKIGISCGLSVHSHGQFSATRFVDFGKIERLRKNMESLATLLRHTVRLWNILWQREFESHYSRRWCNLFHWIFQNCTARRWWSKLLMRFTRKIIYKINARFRFQWCCWIIVRRPTTTSTRPFYKNGPVPQMFDSVFWERKICSVIWCLSPDKIQPLRDV